MANYCVYPLKFHQFCMVTIQALTGKLVKLYLNIGRILSKVENLRIYGKTLTLKVCKDSKLIL